MATSTNSSKVMKDPKSHNIYIREDKGVTSSLKSNSLADAKRSGTTRNNTMISGKGQGAVERSLGHAKYETTAFISEEGLRSDASMVYNPQPTILGIALEESNLEEMHYHHISFHKGM